MAEADYIHISIGEWELGADGKKASGGTYVYEQRRDASGRIVEREEGTPPPKFAPLVRFLKGTAEASVERKAEKAHLRDRLLDLCRRRAAVGEGGTFTLSCRETGEQLDVPTTTARLAIRRLLDEGVLERVAPGRLAGGLGGSIPTTYRLKFTKGAK